ncbi:MAG: RHS repeat-associated core domain-containing protein, partial [Blastocatellia bacterium]|nr:RHS repeat-associated core domain-containing protein [Blastocatellia bacterium]
MSPNGQHRSEWITGGTITYDTQTKSTTRGSGQSVHSYTLTRFDDENRPVAEMQQTVGSVTAVWNSTANSFIVDGTSTLIPTKQYVYDPDDRLAAVELPAVANPLNSNTIERPRYEYAYDEQGNQTLIRDPLNRETRFTFTDRGQQATRTLPLGFGSDGIASTADLSTLNSQPATLPFTERMTYDNRGRQQLHVSFEGIVAENVYDSFGRLSHVNYYASETTYTAGTIAERWNYLYDEYGRKDAAIHSVNVSGTLTPDRAEETVYDNRGRIVAEVGDEGSLVYSYDALGRMVSVAVRSASVALTASAERVTHYGYDILGRLASVKEDATPSNTADATLDTEHAFDLQGRMDITALPDGVVTDYDYDALGRLDTQTDKNSGGQTLASYDYTVRADGKRTGLGESVWFDANYDGIRDTSEVKATAYGWTYDPLGRLTDEVITHFDTSISQSEHFKYDLTGNRTTLERDNDLDSVIDEIITYDYDVNDRLLTELLDNVADNTKDQTTTYGYDDTQQISKSVSVNSVQSAVQLFAYNLQGRMSSVTNQGYDNTGALNSRDRTSYEYDSKSFRVQLSNEVDTPLNGTFTLTSRTEFLADSHNHTGYTQTVRETTFNSDGSTKTIDYTFGNDEILQRVVERDSQAGVTSDVIHVFGHDGHGSVRVLYDVAGVIAQAFSFAAYGQMLAVHGATANSLAITAAATSLGYSGEHFDAKAQQQYLRARFYDPANGRFNRVDPFAGNMQDPQTLHKYAYVHGDPIGMTDPTGMFGLGGTLGAIGIGATLHISTLMQGSLTILTLNTIGHTGMQ